MLKFYPGAFKRLFSKVSANLFSGLFGSSITTKELFLSRLSEHAIPLFIDFDLPKVKKQTLNFLESLRMPSGKFDFRFSLACEEPILYSSIYAVMLFSLFGEISQLSVQEKRSWGDYFDSFQNSSDGLFYDPIFDASSANSDWWGVRHLALHIITAYRALDRIPQHPFLFLKKFYEKAFLDSWLEAQDWNSSFSPKNDFDNQVLNIGSLLQFQRDFWNDHKAGDSIKFILDFLFRKINPSTGMWGQFDLSQPPQRSRMIQFAYHIFLLFFYDQTPLPFPEKVLEVTLSSQNRYGGFGPEEFSSACEDIDSIDILCRFSRRSGLLKDEVANSLKRAIIWILSNQNEDGGFVFRRGQPLFYGHSEMQCKVNQSALFPTWFRILSLAYASSHVFNSHWPLVKCPGLEQ